MLILGDQQEQFHNGGALIRKQLFKIVDVLITALAGFGVDPFVHARNQHVLIVAAVEHANHSLAGARLMHAP